MQEESKWLIALASGDFNAFNVLYEKYHRALYHFSLRLSKNTHEAEELVQSVFVTVWETRQTIDPSKSFSAYLFNIARNRFYDMLRRRVVESCYADYILHQDQPEMDDDLEKQLEDRETNEIIQKLLQQVPERRKEIFRLRHEEDLSYKQIAEIARIDPQCDGYSYWTLIDFLNRYGKAREWEFGKPIGGGEYDTGAQGMFDVFWGSKSNDVTPQDVAKVNSATAILMKLEGREPVPVDYGDGRTKYGCFSFKYLPLDYSILVEDDTVHASIFISHFGYDDLKDESVIWTIQSGEKTVLNSVIDHVNLQTGDVKKTCEIRFVVPHCESAEHWRLETKLGNVTTNDWDFWVFPKRQKQSLKGFAVTQALYDTLAKQYDGFVLAGTPEGDAADRVIGTPDCPETARAIAAEKRVVLIGDTDGPPNVELGWWYPSAQTGIAFAHHPAFGNFPHDGYISPLWFRIIKKGMPVSKTMPFEKMEYLAVGEGPGNYFMYAAQAFAGNKGKILMTHGLDVLSGAPEATYLLDQMLQYISSDH